MSSLYLVPLTLNDGTKTDFGRFKGKVVLVVNVASQCGLTPQYAGLERIYQKFQDQGFEILGVPSNQFAGQEPGGDDEIAEFCQRSFVVTFSLSTKSDEVLGSVLMTHDMDSSCCPAASTSRKAMETLTLGGAFSVAHTEASARLTESRSKAETE